jgi:hypothetical protein
MRVWTAKKSHVEHSRKLNVLGKVSGAGYQGPVFDAPYRRAYKSSRGVLCLHDEASYLKNALGSGS